MTPQMRLFSVITLTPVVLIGGAAVWGGFWVLAAAVYLTVLAGILDRLVHKITPATEFPAGDGLSVTLAFAHFALLPTVVFALAANELHALEKLGLFFAAGLFFGQVSNANAHELIHSSTRGRHRLGMWIYISLLFGHHTSAHVLIHHKAVATPADPNTSRWGENFYRFAVRAWTGSFQLGYQAEAARLKTSGRSAWRNPYVIYIAGALVAMGIALSISPKALVFYVLLAGHAQMQLLMSDYVQHYGLMRATAPSGKSVPVGPAHSWNSPHWFSSALMLNATRHSDHHAHPARPYPALTLPPDVPTLPKPLPMMAAIALVPPIWRKIMDPAVKRWRNV